MVGVSDSEIDQYEKGKRRINCSILWEFSQIFNVKTSYFHQSLKEYNLKQEIPQLLKYYKSISDKAVRDDIVNIIYNLSRQ